MLDISSSMDNTQSSAQSAAAGETTFNSLSWAFTGKLKCTGSDGKFLFLDPDTKFVSYCTTTYAGVVLSALFLLPFLFRTFDLSRYEKGRLSINGQMAKISSLLAPTAYTSWMFLTHRPLTLAEGFVIIVGYLASMLHYVQEGRVTVCCGELLGYWFGMIVIYSSATLGTFLKKDGSRMDWVLGLSAVFSVITMALEAPNHRESYRAKDNRIHFDDVNVFSKLSLSYANPIIKKGSKGPINKDDFPHAPAGLKASTIYHEFHEKLATVPRQGKYRVFKALFLLLRGQLFLLIILDLISELVSYTQPALLALFLNSLAASTEDETRTFTSYYLSILLSVTPLISTSVSNLVSLISSYCSMSINLAVESAIFRKALVLSPMGRERFEHSKITNMISVDSQQLVKLSQIIPIFTNTPIALAVSIWQLWHFLGSSMFSAALVYMIIVPLTSHFSAKMRPKYPSLMVAKDKRNKMTSNLFRNIKSMKLYSWEEPFKDKIEEVRDTEELEIQRTIQKTMSILGIIWNTSGDFIAASVFISYLYLKQGVLSPEIVFPSILLLQYATVPFMAVPACINVFYQCITSQNRVDSLLRETEQDHANYYKLSAASNGYNEPSVIIDNVSISWNGEQTEQKTALRNVSVTATRGDLICVIGRVGSGKTALLKALADELCIFDGSVTIKGTLATCLQDPWLQNQTIRSNILFGEVYNEKWYNAVIDVCELKPDIKQMPKGDDTMVGERGITLSGGQKARVALARAVYSRADVFLLDDVLSAVDEHVGSRLIENLFSSHGLLANRTIFLATNNVKILSHSSLIVAIDNKNVEAANSFADVVRQGEDSKIYKLIREFGNADDLKREANHIEDRKAMVEEQEQKNPSYYPVSLHSQPLNVTATNFRLSSDDAEEQEEDAVSLQIYKRYFTSMSPWIGIGFLAIAIFSCVTSNSISIYLGYMSNKALGSLHEARWYIVGYLSVVVISSIMIFVSDCWCNITLAMKASKSLHNRMLWNVMHAPMGFFDTTPLGRLINRFTQDISLLDRSVPSVLNSSTRSLINLVVNLVTIISGGPIVALIILPLGYIGNSFRKTYVPTSRKVSRIRAAANSPILSHMDESLKGQETLRTFDRVNQFIEIYDQRVDYWSGISYLRRNLSQWLGFRIQMMCAVLTLSAAASVTHLTGKGYISVGYGAVVLHFSSRAGSLVKQSLTNLAQLEVSGVSLARIFEYIDIDQEAPAHIEETEPPKSWPDKGVVKFKGLSARYSPHGNDILKNISFSINACEKIGIVGRTGSGKSSLTMTIFRILEAHSGHIEIDGTNTSKLGLFDLRSRLAIIPQDAHIFDGTLRENLDPFRTKDDARLWEVLELCHLKDYFKAQELGLDTPLKGNGGNLSRGQSQLVCLGRALVHHAKVLVLDEATASVDVETDKIVQDTIRTNFKDRTIITIAHRLNTIIDSDRIIVLDEGEVKEFDTPRNLLDSKGLFYRLCNSEKHVEGSDYI